MITTAIISLLGTIAVAEPIIFYSIYRKKKKAEVTDANLENSKALIELQEKYIDLVNDKDVKIRELNEELLKAKEDLVYYKTTHCVKIKCTRREPPLKDELRKEYDNNEFNSESDQDSDSSSNNC